MADNDLASLLAGAAKTNANFNFDELNKSYWEGLDQAYKQKERSLFEKGVPTKDGAVDWDKVSSATLQAGGVPALGTLTALQKVMIEDRIRQNLGGMATEAFQGPGQPPPQRLPPSTSGNQATQTERKPVAADDPTMTIPPRQVAAANAPQSAPQQLPAPPPVPPYVPRPVQTPPIAPQQQAQAPPQIPMPPQRPVVPQAPPPQMQPVVNPIANPQPPVPQPPIPQPAIGAITPEIEAGLHASGLVPQGRSVADHVALLSRYGQLAQSTGVRDAGKTYLDRLDQIAKAIGDYRQAGLKERQSVIEPAVKAQIDRIGQSQAKTEAIADGITVSHDLMAQLDSKSGIFSGAMATQKLWMAKVAEALNITGVDPRTTNTEAFSALVGKKVAQTVKSFGSGTSITNQDREYAAKMEAGDIKLDETSMRRILQITDKINRAVIDKHNQQVDAITKSRPELAHLSQTMKVDQPPPYASGPRQLREGDIIRHPQTGLRRQVKNGQLVDIP